jgi:hypothetical protein
LKQWLAAAKPAHLLAMLSCFSVLLLLWLLPLCDTACFPCYLQALSKYAFGMGSLQVILSTLLFTAVALPVGSGLGTWFLEVVCHAPPSLVSIRTVDEVSTSRDLTVYVQHLIAAQGTCWLLLPNLLY